MPRIIVVPRTEDWKAYVEGHPEWWGCGSTPTSAVGDLVISHNVKIGIEIIYPEGKTLGRH